MKLITQDGHEVTKTLETLSGLTWIGPIVVCGDGSIRLDEQADTEVLFEGITNTAPDGQRKFVHPETGGTILEKDLLLVPDHWNQGDEIPEDARPPFVDTARYDQIVRLAKEWHEDDEIRIAPDARISEGDENGCHVQAWVWVPFDGIPGLDKQPDHD